MPLKRLCEILGIDHEGQRRKVRNNPALSTELISVPGTDGRPRRMLCLPVKAIGYWTFTVDPDTVRPEVLKALDGVLKEHDASTGNKENHEGSADSPMDRKGHAYNCLGNLNWFLDTFLLWASELADNNGDYFPRDDQIIKASAEEVGKYVRRVRCNIRVLQAIIDATIEYENLDDPLDKHELIEFYNESVKLYKSTGDLIHGFDNGPTGSQCTGHSYLDYLCGPALDAVTEFGDEIIMNFHKKIIPRKE